MEETEVGEADDAMLLREIVGATEGAASKSH
jgi:hypothetical protein